jgi:phage N-6-adenine-methyltransferase
LKRSKSEPRLPFTEEYYSARTDNGEWYTPAPIVQRVKTALGGVIDLDPFTCKEAQQIVQAHHYFTRETDGIRSEWPVGRTLFANPPYARIVMGECVHRVVIEHGLTWQYGIVLVNNATDAGWFHELLDISSAMCIFTRRIQFTQPQGMTVDRNTRGQVALYIGDERDRFRHAFADLGKICEF